MADRKISDLTALTAPASGDYLPIVDISEAAAASKNKRITIEELFRGVPLGAAAAPSIAIEGDENTGIYSPGADQLAISTNGSGRLFVDASGNVGVGTSLLFGKPTNANRVSYAGGGYSDTNIPALGLALYRSQTGEHGHLFWSGQSTGGNTRVLGSIRMEQTVATVANGGGDIIFNTNPGTAEQPTERLRITSDGTVNIKGAGTAGVTQAVSFNGSAPVNSLVIASSGRVGLGTSSPSARLSVEAGSSDTTPLLTSLGSINGSEGAIFLRGGSTAGFYYDFKRNASTGSLEIQGNQTSFNNICLAPTSGRVGIGTTSPGAKLEITNGHIRLSDQYRIGVGGTGDTPDQTTIKFSSDNLGFFTGNTERARIDSSGRLLVGTSSGRVIPFATPTFQVVGTGYSVANILAWGNSNDTLGGFISLGKSRGTSHEIVSSGDVLGGFEFLGSDGSQAQVAARIRCEVDGTPGAADMPGRLVFSTTADGAASPTERLRITSAGVLQVADAGNIAFGTTTGTKIGTATTQKLGFFNKTPVVQPTAVADATDAASVITQLNALLSRMRDLGLIAT